MSKINVVSCKVNTANGAAEIRVLDKNVLMTNLLEFCESSDIFQQDLSRELVESHGEAFALGRKYEKSRISKLLKDLQDNVEKLEGDNKHLMYLCNKRGVFQK